MIASNSGAALAHQDEHVAGAHALRLPVPHMPWRSSPPAGPAGWSRSIRRTAHPSASISLFGSALMIGHTSTTPGAASGSGSMHRLDLVGRKAAQRLRSREHGVDRVEHVRAGAERVAETSRAAARARRPATTSRRPCASRRTRAAPRPGTKRSTASRRRPRRSCGGPAARPRRRRTRRSGERTISHCFGLVSCASSTSTWSMPWSSL